MHGVHRAKDMCHGRNGVFTWTLTPYSDPFGKENCVYAPDVAAVGHSTYHIVVSDSDDFNVVKNISILTQVRGPAHARNTITVVAAGSRALCISVGKPAPKLLLIAPCSIQQLLCAYGNQIDVEV